MKKKIVSLIMGLLILATSCGSNQKASQSENNDDKKISSEESTSDKISADDSKQDMVEQTDVLVIGSGLSGASTAISALENGLSVTVVDKAPVFGISFLSSKGNMLNAMVEENKDSHLIESDDTLDEAIQRWENLSKIGNNQGWDDVNYERVKTVLVESANSIKWLEDMGIQMEPSFSIDERGQDVAKVVKQGEESEGKTLAEALEKKIIDQGGKIYLQTEATDLIKDKADVIGAKLSRDGEVGEIKAKHVVLAMGGYGGSEKFISEKIPNLEKLGYNYMGNDLNQGDAIDLVEGLEVKEFENNWIIPSPFALKPSKELTEKNDFYKDLNYLSSYEDDFIKKRILVGVDFKRFTDESSNPSQVLADIIDYKEEGVYLVIDHKDTDLINKIEKDLDGKNIIKVEETTDNYQTLNEEIKNFNSKNQADNRYTYSEEGPYYLISMQPEFVATMGGLVTDENYQVLNKDNEKVNGLYAVGEIAHKNLYNRNQFANVSNSASISMGKLLGIHLSE